MVDKNAEIEKIPNKDKNAEEGSRCTCKDEFISFPFVPCPVHPPTKNPYEDEEEEVRLVTDADIIPEHQGYIMGHKFRCPYCKIDAVLVNDKMGDECCVCHGKVTVKSDIVTKFLRGVGE
jgi:hypothetical protein